MTKQEKRPTLSILGAGWLGTALAKNLPPSQVKVSTTTPEKHNTFLKEGLDAYLLTLPIQDAPSTLNTFFNSDVIIITLPFKRSYKDPKDYFYLIKGLIPFLEKPLIKRVIFTSSTSIYPLNNDIVTEETPFDQSSERAKVLFETEQLLLQNPHFETTILRFGGLYGYDRQPGRFLALKKSPTYAKEPVNLIHQDDAVGILKAAIHHPRSNLIFNAVSDNHPTKKDFYSFHAAQQGFPLPTFLEGDECLYKIVSNKRVKEILGYQFIYLDPLDVSG